MDGVNIFLKIAGSVFVVIFMALVATAAPPEDPVKAIQGTILLATVAIIIAMPIPPTKGDE